MPLYEYACTSCSHHFDVRHGANEVPILSCPQCDGAVKKVFHAAGIIFKGSGWYITDNASKSSLSSEKSETTEKKEEKSSSAGESKDATTTPAAT